VSLRNFGWLTEGEIAGCALLGPDLCDALTRAGVGAVLSLTEWNPFEEVDVGDAIRVCHEPVRDMTAPSLDTIRAAIRFLEAMRAEGRAVVVHCLGGYGRTGTILACWLVSRGVPPDDAIAEVRHRRPGSIETASQERAIYDWAMEVGAS